MFVHIYRKNDIFYRFYWRTDNKTDKVLSLYSVNNIRQNQPDKNQITSRITELRRIFHTFIIKNIDANYTHRARFMSLIAFLQFAEQ